MDEGIDSRCYYDIVVDRPKGNQLKSFETVHSEQSPVYSLQHQRRTSSVAILAHSTVNGWNVARLNKTALHEFLNATPTQADLNLVNIGKSVEQLLKRNISLIASWCDACMP